MFVPIIKTEEQEIKRSPTKTTKTPLWDEEEEIDKRQETLIISIRGLQKVGKTHLLMSSVELDTIDFMGFKINSGRPLYYIDLENAAKLEREHHFEKYKKDIKIKTPVVFDENNKIDYVQSYKNFVNLIDEIFNSVDTGILCIDGASFIGDATYYLLIDKVLGIGFNELGKPNKKPQPHEYTWRKKEHKELFTKLRYMKIPVFLTNKVKKETAPDQEKNYFKYTGSYIEDSIEGTPYHYDMEITLEKEIKDADIVRVAKIYDSRFEEETVPVLRYTIENPSMQKIFDRLKANLKS